MEQKCDEESGNAVRRRMHEELKGVGSSTRLAAQVAACVGKALRLLAEKAEYMAATGAPRPSIPRYSRHNLHIIYVPHCSMCSD